MHPYTSAKKLQNDTHNFSETAAAWNGMLKAIIPGPPAHDPHTWLYSPIHRAIQKAPTMKAHFSLICPTSLSMIGKDL